nr:hypothetical protein CFP56_50134 [Quercus suber]
MVNQVSGSFGFDASHIGFPNAQSNVLPTQGVQSDGMIQNLVNTPFGAQTGFQNGVGNSSFGIAQGASGNLVGSPFLQQNSGGGPSSYQPQCSISPAQCEQLLSFLKGYAGSASGSGFGTHSSHVASVMTPNALSTLPQTSSPSSFNSTSSSSNFSAVQYIFILDEEVDHKIDSINMQEEERST